MTAKTMNPVRLVILILLVTALVLVVDLLFLDGTDGTFLLTLSFWTALSQGAVALVAAAEVARGKWIAPIRRELLSFYPLILVAAIMFAFMGVKLEMYPWVGEHHRWLKPSFFMWRNVVVLFLSYRTAHYYARATLKNESSRGKWAVVYLFLFILSQNLIAFDWIMSLEFPWISTLFGGIFFMESFYMGIAVAALVAVRLLQEKEGTRKVLRDAATFLFGFALAWAGLFYAQYLVIWYGNLPEETSFLLERMHLVPYREMFWGVLVFLFVVPFVVLVSRKAKQSAVVVSLMAALVLLGVLVERIVYIAPVVPITFWAALVSFLLLGYLTWMLFRQRAVFLPEEKM